jgi:uncharacterized membrane protein YgdD (TMEM256/DUF423 family)
MIRLFLAIAAIYGGLAVAGGAFAAHALQGKLSDKAISIFETGTRYQMYHALALFLVVVLLLQNPMNPTWLTVAGYAFIVGVLIFSGSLYALSFSGIKWLGAITPIGGVAFIIGWGCLLLSALSFKA